MHYDDAVAAFFAPRSEGTPLPPVVREPTAARRLRDAVEPVAMHPVWSRAVNEHLAGLGLDFLTGYVGGRAAVLGQVRPAVAAASFAWFEPQVVAAVVEAAWSVLPPERLLAEREAATVRSLRELLGDEVSQVADLLADAAVAADGTGRPLFTGVRDRGRPEDPVHRLWWACELVREHRGDSHVAAANAAAIGPVEMNVLTELWLGMPMLSYSATRVWSPEALEVAVTSLRRRGWVEGEALTSQGRAARDAVEAATDAQEAAVVAGLGDRLAEVCAQLDAWGEQCVAAGAFPGDVLKRAAG